MTTQNTGAGPSVLVLSPSRMKTWVRCRKSYQWKYHYHLQRQLKEVPLTLGSIASEIFEAYYKTLPELRTQSLMVTLTSSKILEHKNEFLGNDPKPERQDEWNKIVKNLAVVFSGYKSWADSYPQFSDHELEILEVENPRTIHLTDKLDLLAKPDAKVLFHGEPTIFEHKLLYTHKYRVGDYGIDYQSVGSCLVTDSMGTLFNVVEYSKPKLHRDTYIRDKFEMGYFRKLFIEIGNEILNTPDEKMYMQPMRRCSCSYWELCLAEMKGLDIQDIVDELYTLRTKDSPKEEPKDNIELEVEVQ